jgi:hypothetical protein
VLVKNFRFVGLDTSGDSAGTNKKFRINGLGKLVRDGVYT